MTKTKTITIEPGDLFVVPLDEDCYALGLASRVSKNRGTKTVLGYFFDTTFSTVPTIAEIPNLKPCAAILIARFSGQSIMETQWPKIGTYQNWDPEKWPMPSFCRQNVVTPSWGWLIKYQNDDPQVRITEEPCNFADVATLPSDGLFGCGAVLMVLKHKIITRQID